MFDKVDMKKLRRECKRNRLVVVVDWNTFYKFKEKLKNKKNKNYINLHVVDTRMDFNEDAFQYTNMNEFTNSFKNCGKELLIVASS